MRLRTGVIVGVLSYLGAAPLAQEKDLGAVDGALVEHDGRHEPLGGPPPMC
jgi:hypothetical protein